MLKYLRLRLIFGIGILASFNVNAQQFADKSYYLVDSLVLEDFSEQDLELMEKYLAEFHASESDTVKLQAISNLVHKMTNNDWVKFNSLLYHISEQKLKEELDSAERMFYHVKLAVATNNQAYLYDIEGKTDLAIEKNKEALNLYYQISDSSGIATGLSNLGAVYDRIGDFKTAIAYYNESLKITRKINMLDQRASTLNNLGLLYDDMGDTKAGLKCLYESLSLYDSLGIERNAVRVSNNIGIIYYDQLDFDKAFEYHFKALKLSREIGFKKGISQSLGAMASCYVSTNQFNSAEECLKSSLEINETIGSSRGIINDKMNLGELYTRMRRFEESQQILNEALSLAQTTENLLYVLEIKNFLSNSYLKSGEAETAISLVRENLEACRELGVPSIERDALFILSECYKSIDDFDNGWEVYEQYLLLNDSVENTSIKDKALVEEADYLLSVKDREVDLLKEQAKLKDYLLFGLLAFITLVIILSLVGYRILKKRKLKNENAEPKAVETDSKTTSNELSFELALINSKLSNPLSQRELNVLEELVKGNSNKEIADSLFISINTVKSHLIKIYAKLEVKNRISAVQKIQALKPTGNS